MASEPSARDEEETGQEGAQDAAHRVHRAQRGRVAGAPPQRKGLHAEERRIHHAEHDRRRQQQARRLGPAQHLSLGERGQASAPADELVRDSGPERELPGEQHAAGQEHRAEGGAGDRPLLAHQPGRQRAADPEARQHEREHGRERVDAVAEHRADEMRPDDLETEEQEPGEQPDREQERDALAPGRFRRTRGSGPGRDRPDARPPGRETERREAGCGVHAARQQEGSPEPEGGKEQVRAEKRAEERTRQVERVEPRHRAARLRDAHLLQRVDDRREARAHQERGRQDPDARHHESQGLKDPEPVGAEPEQRHEPLDAASGGEGEEQRPDRDASLEHRVGAERRPAAGQLPSVGQAAQRQAEKVDGQDDRRRGRARADEAGQHLLEALLGEEPRAAGQHEEDAQDPDGAGQISSTRDQSGSARGSSLSLQSM